MDRKKNAKPERDPFVVVTPGLSQTDAGWNYGHTAAIAMCVGRAGAGVSDPNPHAFYPRDGVYAGHNASFYCPLHRREHELVGLLEAVEGGLIAIDAGDVEGSVLALRLKDLVANARRFEREQHGRRTAARQRAS
jgi:hypothetical protein